MTWTKLGDEFSDEARDLTDAAFRTHVEALMWSNRRGLDLQVPKRDLKRFAETDDPETAVKVLTVNDWWRDDGDSWFIGLRFGDWQLEKSVVDKRKEQSALTTRRNRLHKIGDHSICLPKNCSANKVGDTSHDTSHERSPGTGRVGAVRDRARSAYPRGRGAEGSTLRTPAPAVEHCSKPGHEFAIVNSHGCAACRSEGLGASA